MTLVQFILKLTIVLFWPCASLLAMLAYAALLPQELLFVKEAPLEPVRRWGCNRTETPFIFVHIGKAGGGEVRRRIAAAAVNYTRPNDSSARAGGWIERDAYYPVDVRLAGGKRLTVLARFDPSGHRNWRPNDSCCDKCIGARQNTLGRVLP